jgi:hypothetical protein
LPNSYGYRVGAFRVRGNSRICWEKKVLNAAKWPFPDALIVVARPRAPELPSWSNVAAEPTFLPRRLTWEASMNANTRQTPPGGRKPVTRPVRSEPGPDKEKSKPSKTVAEATGAPKREEAMLAAASQARAIGSEAYPRNVLSAAFESIERSFRAAGLGTVAVNRKLIDMARANVVSGFDLARDLAGARSPLEAARLHMAYFDERMKALAAQAGELRALQAELVSKANEPLREHMLKR